MISPWIFAILSPFFFATYNILDKYILAKKVKAALSYAAVAGIVTIVYALLVGAFLDWSQFKLSNLLFPFISGLFMGLQTFMYFHILSTEDVSNFVGLIYVYPVLVALLSFFFLNERLSLFGYIGGLLTIVGVLTLSLRAQKMKWQVNWWLLIGLIVMIAITEFIIKVQATTLPLMQSFAWSQLFMGLTIVAILFLPKYRRGFFQELKLLPFAFLIEFITLLAMLTLFLAMAGLPAGIVASLQTLQVLAVLFFEKLVDASWNIAKDKDMLKKLIPILCIVVGIVLLYVFG
ncbi:MAG: EamA family transporter [archaeon]